jgi:hypothetical protein
VSLIPLEYYTEVFVNALLLITLIVVFHTSANTGYENNSRMFNNVAGSLVLVSVILYMGLRPISGYYFADMRTYANYFELVARGGTLPDKDVGFTVFLTTCAGLMSVKSFFLLCAVLYVIPLYIAVRRWHKDYAFLALLACIGTFSFWGYGTNGIRAGLASSFFICALSYRKLFPIMLMFLLLSISFHKSMMLPLLAFAVTYIYNKPKTYLLGWCAAIILSAVMGGFWESFFAALGFGDVRFAGYLTSTELAHQFSSTGFRWDFLLYSSVTVIVGYLYIYKFKFQDKFYHQLYNTYVICNAFWIMVIRASFSNRFAYLSWFLMALVIIYPLLKHKMFRFQYSKIGYVLFFNYLFTYAMYYIIQAR